jgi:hypothetical protein
VIKSRRLRWEGNVARMRGGAFRVLVGENEGKDLLEDPSIWEDNIKMDFSRSGMRVIDWIDLAQRRDR